MSNTLGKIFRITTWGESHGEGVGVVIDGCPAGIPLSISDIETELDRRRPGQSQITTQRREGDIPIIFSGVFQGVTLGTPIMIMVKNQDARGKDYRETEETFRPSHADYTYEAKYGVRDWKGGGRASARETVGRVAAGAIAHKILSMQNIEIVGYVKKVWDIVADVDSDHVTRADVETNEVRCPDVSVAKTMIERIKKARKDGDSLGGVVEVVARGVPPGLGEPVFDKLDAQLAGALLSLPACKGFEIGSGFDGTSMTGSEHNDPFYSDSGRIRTRTNHSGGVQGGISNGENILVRAAFKPTATIAKEQNTVNKFGKETTIKGRGRHDPCVLPRAVPMVESMVALVLCDLLLRQSVNPAR
ncbi:MAG: chorismate synthase [Dehalococcoidia bacterium]|nr:chorismate synthase [Chloroflexota bacterium]